MNLRVEFCQRWKIPVRMVNAKRSLAGTERKLECYRRAGMFWLVENGIGRRVLEVADEREFEIRFSREINKVKAIMAALAVFGIDEAGQQVRVIKAMKDETIEGEVVMEGGKRGRGLNQDYVDNCVAVSVIFQAAGFTEDALTEARGAFLNAIDDDVHSVSMQRVASQILRIAIREGVCQQLICRAYTGEKRKMLAFHLSSPDMMSRIVLRSPEELEARCAELSRVGVVHGKVRVYPARAKDAQYALCVAYSDKLISDRAIYLMEQHSFPQEAFDADPFILTIKSPSVNKSYAASSFLKAVNWMIGRKKYDRAMQLISQAEKLGVEEARNEVRQAIFAYKAAIPLFLQAAAMVNFSIAMDCLRQSYELCLSSQGAGELKVERALCSTLISQLRTQAGQRIYLHYQDEAKRLEAAVGELFCRRGSAETEGDSLQSAKLILEEKKLYIEAERVKTWLALADRFSETKCGDECFAIFVLMLFPVENSFVVPDEMLARVNQYGEKIIDGDEAVEKIKRADLAGKKRLESQRPLLIAAKLFILNLFQVDFVSYLYLSLAHGIDLLVGSKAAQRFNAAEIGHLARLADQWGAPFTRKERFVVGHSGLAEAAIGEIAGNLERRVAVPSDFWKDFYLTVVPALSAKIKRLCDAYAIPPVIFTKKSVTDPNKLINILEIIRKANLLWLVQNGFGKEWFRPCSTEDLRRNVQQMQERIAQLQEILHIFGVNEGQYQEIVLSFIVGSNLNSIRLKNYAVLAQLCQAVRRMEITEEHLQRVISFVLKEGDTEVACRALFKLFGDQVGSAVASFQGVKREAMEQHAQSMDGLVSLAMLSDEEIVKRMAALEKMSFAVALPDKKEFISPFRQRSACLCLCVERDLAGLQGVAEALARQWGFSQHVFDANPRLVYRQYQQDTLHVTGAVRALVATYSYVLTDDVAGQTTDARVYLRAALNLLEPFSNSIVRREVEALLEGRKPPPKRSTKPRPSSTPISTGELEAMLVLPCEEALCFSPISEAEIATKVEPIGQISEEVEEMLIAPDSQYQAAEVEAERMSSELRISEVQLDNLLEGKGKPKSEIVVAVDARPSTIRVAEIIETYEDRGEGIGLRLRALQHVTGRARFETARLADILLGYCFIDMESWQTIFGNIEEILELLEKPKTDFVVIKPLIDRLENRPEEIKKRLLLAKGVMSEVRNISPASITVAERALAQLEILPIAAIALSTLPEGGGLLKEIDSTKMFFNGRIAFIDGILARRKGR